MRRSSTRAGGSLDRARARPLSLSLGLLAALASGCRDSPLEPPGDPLPQVLSVQVAAAGGAIFRTLSVELDRDARLIVEYWANGEDRLQVETRESGRSHTVFLPRLRADRTYAFEARAQAAGSDPGEPRGGTFHTDPLPDGLAALEFRVTGEATFELLFLEIGQPSGPHFPIIVDTRGEVVWYSGHPGRSASGFTLFQDTLFAFNTAEGILVVSPTSQEVVAGLSRARGAARTGIDPFFIHHDVTATGEGTLLFLALDPTPFGDTVWMGEGVWEWDPLTDDLTLRWRSADFLDPALDRGPRSRPDDWLHANGLSIGPRGNVLISFFWLHEVLSIAPGWGAVEWRLGGPRSTFDGVAEAMESGQHTPAEVAPGRVLLFDNGLDRGVGRFSRVLEIALDVEGGSAEVVWEFRPSPDIYAPIVSSVHRLPNGNTVANFGLAEGLFGGQSTGPLAFFEVTPEGTEAWRMEVVDGARLVYRATPIDRVADERPGRVP